MRPLTALETVTEKLTETQSVMSYLNEYSPAYKQLVREAAEYKQAKDYLERIHENPMEIV